VYLDAAQDDADPGAGDDDAVAAGREDRAQGPAAIQGDRLGDGHRAEPAGIKAVDLAARGGLRDGAGKRLARRGAAARVDVVADAGNPGAGGLGAGRGGGKQSQRKGGAAKKRSSSHAAFPAGEEAAAARPARTAPRPARRMQSA